MSITIRHLEDRFANLDGVFPTSTDEIIFGRSSECNVVYPAGDDAVAPTHLKLTRTETGTLRVEVLGTRSVEVDGRQITKQDGPIEIDFGSTIKLNSEGGPSFRVWILTVSIHHIDGPLSGQRQDFDNSHEVITVGRAPENDVIFPPACETVGRRHLLFRRTWFGTYVVEFSEDHYVSVDGRPVRHGFNAQIKSGSLLRLGNRNGPSFKVNWCNFHPAGSADTKLNEYVTRAADVVQKNKRAMVMGLGAISSLLVAFGIGVFLLNREVDQELAKMEERQAELAKGTFRSPDVIKTLQSGVYLLVQRTPDHQEIPIATAWAIGPSELATNAHVVKALNCIVNRKDCKELNAGGTVWLRGPQLDHDIQVTGWRAHDGYDAFPEELAKIARSFPALGDWSLASAYDVGVLDVEETLQPPYLTIASPERLRGLPVGAAVAYAGFPSRDMEGQAVAIKSPKPTVQYGYISSLADVFMSHTDDPDERLLVQHSIPGTGGSSGSPIITTDGEVVAIFSGGNITKIEGKGVPNAAMVNFAQRADLLDAVLNGNAAAAVERDRAFWQQRAAELDNFHELALDAFKSEAQRVSNVDEQPKLVTVEEGELRSGLAALGATRISHRHESMLWPGWLYGFIVITEDRQPMGLYLEHGSKRVGLVSEGKYFGRYVDPTDWLEVESPTKIEPVVWGLTSQPLKYKLHVYRWKLPPAEGLEANRLHDD